MKLNKDIFYILIGVIVIIVLFLFIRNLIIGPKLLGTWNSETNSIYFGDKRCIINYLKWKKSTTGKYNIANSKIYVYADGQKLTFVKNKNVLECTQSSDRGILLN